MTVPLPSVRLKEKLDVRCVLEVLQAQVAGEPDPLSKFADAVLDFYELDQDAHRFQVHARVFKGMEIAEYLERYI